MRTVTHLQLFRFKYVTIVQQEYPDAPETAAEGEAQPAVQDEQQPAADTEQNPDAIAPEN